MNFAAYIVADGAFKNMHVIKDTENRVLMAGALADYVSALLKVTDAVPVFIIMSFKGQRIPAVDTACPVTVVIRLIRVISRFTVHRVCDGDPVSGYGAAAEQAGIGICAECRVQVYFRCIAHFAGT